MPYFLPTRIHFGEGCLKELSTLPAVSKAKRIALVIGGKSLRKTGTLTRIESLLHGKTVTLLEGIPETPGPADLAQAVKRMQEASTECVIAIGGGSVLDLAKAAAFAVTQNVPPLDLLHKKLPATPSASLPFVAVPTTAGTGSEVTPWSVFWDKETKTKYSLSHPLMFPGDALVDPVLTYSVPPHVTANTGMDAFTQACEAYWNKNCNPTSDAFALEAVQLILLTLPKAVENGQDQSARHDLMQGSLRAGQAFSNTRTTACHSISYPMTLYFGIPHGQAVGITLPEILVLNALRMDEERRKRFCSAIGVKTIEDAANRIREMMTASGLQTRLSKIGIPREGIATIVEHGFTPGRMDNNPYPLTPETLRELLTRIF